MAKRAGGHGRDEHGRDEHGRDEHGRRGGGPLAWMHAHPREAAVAVVGGGALLYLYLRRQSAAGSASSTALGTVPGTAAAPTVMPAATAAPAGYASYDGTGASDTGYSGADLAGIQGQLAGIASSLSQITANGAPAGTQAAASSARPVLARSAPKMTAPHRRNRWVPSLRASGRYDIQKTATGHGLTEKRLLQLNPGLRHLAGSGRAIPKGTRIRL